MSVHPQTITILFLLASPANEARRRLQEEVREIEAGLQRTKHRNQIALEQRWGFSSIDWRRALLEVKPQIVHFRGYGSVEQQLANSEALKRLFEVFSDQVECVVLQGCYSRREAEAIRRHIPYVVEMNQVIGDRAAIKFAIGFYDAVGAERNYEFAYYLGCKAINLSGIPEKLTTKLYKNEGVKLERNSIEKSAQNDVNLALEIWKEKGAYLQNQEAINANPVQKFKLSKQIEECQEKIKEQPLTVTEHPPLDKMTLRQLRRVAAEYNISRKSRMRKSQLMAAVLAAIETTDSQDKPSIQEEQKVEGSKFELGHENNEEYAIARIKDHQSGQPFYLGQIYELQAGIRSSIPAGFKGVPVELPHQEKPIQLEIVVSAEDIEIEPNWLQPYIINRSEESPFVEFKLKPKTSGYKQICVEFLYQRHWLAKIQFEVEVVEVKELVTA